ncbi:hypothetical protein WA158_002379 [Blastocystis sp. Blastoise]
MSDFQNIYNLLNSFKEEFVHLNKNIVDLSESQNRLSSSTDSIERFVQAMCIQKQLVSFDCQSSLNCPSSLPPLESVKKTKKSKQNTSQLNKRTTRISHITRPSLSRTSLDSLGSTNKNNYKSIMDSKKDRSSLPRLSLLSTVNSNSNTISNDSLTDTNEEKKISNNKLKERSIKSSSTQSLQSNKPTKRPAPPLPVEKKINGRVLFSLSHLKEVLPKKYQTPNHINELETILKFIGSKKTEGCQLADIAALTGQKTLVCNEYLNVLIKIGEIERSQNFKKGMNYKINPYKYARFLGVNPNSSTDL